MTYRWSVALVLDEDQRHKDVIGGGAIARIRPSPTLRAELEKAGPGGAGHTYATNGMWYDALDFVSRWILERPGEPSLRSRRAEFLEQPGLKAAADISQDLMSLLGMCPVPGYQNFSRTTLDKVLKAAFVEANALYEGLD